MTPVFPARRAEEFDRLVEGSSTRPARDTRTTDLLELVATLRAVEPVAPRPEFSSSLRTQLLEAAESLLVPDEEVRRLALPPRQRSRDRRIAALVGAATIVGASTSMAVAAQSALPGEVLYPLKRVLEDARTGAQLSDEARGALLLDNATDRLSEVTELLRTGDLREGPHVSSTLVTFSEQSLEASDLILADYEQSGDDSSVEELRSFAAASLEKLAQLEAMLPEEARDELQYAVEVVAEIDAAAAQACPACRGGITQVPPALLSAGQLDEPSVTVLVPAPVVDSGAASGSDGPRGGGSGAATGNGSGGTPDDGDGGLVPGKDSLPTGGDGGATGPIEEIAEALTGKAGKAGQGGQGGANTSTGGSTGVDPLDDVLDSVDGAVDGTVGGLTD